MSARKRGRRERCSGCSRLPCRGSHGKVKDGQARTRRKVLRSLWGREREEMRCVEQGAAGREARDGEKEGNEKGRTFRNGPSCLCHEALGEDFRL